MKPQKFSNILAVRNINTVFTEQLPTSQALQNYVTSWHQNVEQDTVQTHMSEESESSI
jgi:hypothetical protein